MYTEPNWSFPWLRNPLLLDVFQNVRSSQTWAKFYTTVKFCCYPATKSQSLIDRDWMELSFLTGPSDIKLFFSDILKNCISWKHVIIENIILYLFTEKSSDNDYSVCDNSLSYSARMREITPKCLQNLKNSCTQPSPLPLCVC